MCLNNGKKRETWLLQHPKFHYKCHIIIEARWQERWGMVVVERRGGGGKGMSMEYNEDKWVFRCFLNASAKGHVYQRPKEKCLQHFNGTKCWFIMPCNSNTYIPMTVLHLPVNWQCLKKKKGIRAVQKSNTCNIWHETTNNWSLSVYPTVYEPWSSITWYLTLGLTANQMTSCNDKSLL